MPRAILLVLALAGCGRVGFAAVEAADADPLRPDADPDAPDAFVGAGCGDQVCAIAMGESCGTCADCATGTAVCGNGVCQSGETGASCEYDCGPSPWPDAWELLGGELHVLIDMRRGEGGQCPGMGNLPAVGALATNTDLVRIARSHAWDHSAHDYLPDGPRCSGQTIFDIMSAEGYTGARGAAFYYGGSGGDAQAVLDAWLADGPLCALVMSGAYTQIGVGMSNEGLPQWAAVFY